MCVGSIAGFSKGYDLQEWVSFVTGFQNRLGALRLSSVREVYDGLAPVGPNEPAVLDLPDERSDGEEAPVQGRAARLLQQHRQQGRMILDLADVEPREEDAPAQGRAARLLQQHQQRGRGRYHRQGIGRGAP